MAIRNVRTLGDDILRGTCKPIDEMTPRLRLLIKDMFETMYEYEGVGLAAPQIGIKKRIFVVDVTEDPNEPKKYVMINPEIIETSGEQEGVEGCLSIPGMHGNVKRPNYVKVRAQDEEMNQYELEAEGLLARVILHENDHLDGILYVDKVDGELLKNE